MKLWNLADNKRETSGLIYQIIKGPGLNQNSPVFFGMNGNDFRKFER